MAAGVNLDALIPREDFEVQAEGDEVPTTLTLQVRDLERSAFMYGALRKPDFQRETSEWSPKRVAKLVQTFLDGDLVPAVILWKNRDLVFVIDGSHRLSALAAWVQNDYGDGDRSRTFYGHDIPDEQLKLAQQTRALVEKTVGTYEQHTLAITNPDQYGPDVIQRARRLGSLALQLQWVHGDAAKAEGSFIRINQEPAVITPQEMELIKSRRLPNTIAARAIIRRGTGHKYWSQFPEHAQARIEQLASQAHAMLFEPRLKYPIKSLDLPVGGTDYSSTALRMVYDLVNLAVDTPSDQDDAAGEATIAYLERAVRVMGLLCANTPHSLGLHPAVYFYSWTGKQQPILLLTLAELVVRLQRERRLSSFTETRGHLEDFLVVNRTLVNQVVRKYGTKASGKKHLRQFYDDVLLALRDGRLGEGVVQALVEQDAYSFLQPDEVAYGGTAPTKFSTQVKSGVVMGDMLSRAPRCQICNGYIPSQAISVDHVERRQDGGDSTAANAQLTHPYCNTGIKS